MAVGVWRQNPLMLPEYTYLCRKQDRSPEKRLLAAVLMEAVYEFRAAAQSLDDGGNERLRELQAWFFGHRERWPFAFENVCEHLDLDPDCIRARLSAYAKGCTVERQRRQRTK
ncbi:MAG: hypothetical protein ACE5I7_06795 [Candidatus Binatia bacterium]